jgi:hypothetical protein
MLTVVSICFFFIKTIRSKIAICLIAQHEFQKAQGILRAVCLLAREKTGSLPDRRQFAEVLNNLACVNYLMDEYSEAFVAFTQSLDIQLSLCDDALYLGSKFSSQSSAMNVAVVRANVGFLALVSRDIPTARMAFESSLKVSLELCLRSCLSVPFLPLCLTVTLLTLDSGIAFARRSRQFSIRNGTLSNYSSFRRREGQNITGTIGLKILLNA